MSDTQQEVITWHKYPEEKPSKYGFYLITSINWVGECFYDNGFQEEMDKETIAWAEIPKGYKEE